jgi:very-short-patch-repair endonuclease
MRERIKSSEDITQFDHFFDTIKPLLELEGDITDEHKSVLNYWLKEAKSNLNKHVFVRVALIHLLSALKKLSRNTSIRKILFDKWEKDPKFIWLLLECSQNSLKHVSATQLSIILNSLERFTGYIEPLWMDEWYECSLQKMKEFTCTDFYKTLNAHAEMNLMPPLSWLKEWFNQSCHSEWLETPHAFFQVIRILKALKIDIDEHWLSRWIKLAPEQLVKISENDLGVVDLLHSANLLSIALVEQNNEFMHIWFDKMRVAMPNLDDNQIKHVFHEIVKTGRPVPTAWIESFASRMHSHFNKLGSGEISHMLYAFPCLLIDVTHIQPFLEKSKVYFDKNKTTAFDLKHNQSLRELLIAQNYFRMIGFDLGVDSKPFKSILQVLKDEKRNITDIKAEILVHLNATFRESVEYEVWLDVVCNKVDFYIASQKLIIEVYGMHHFDGEELKQRVKLKHYLLKNAGYSILPLDSREFSDDWFAYVDREVALFLELENRLLKTNGL